VDAIKKSFMEIDERERGGGGGSCTLITPSLTRTLKCSILASSKHSFLREKLSPFPQNILN
jgi:hypothetical protein